MLITSQIVPAAQAQFVTDVNDWANDELYGIKDNDDRKSFTHIVSDMMMMICLADPGIPVSTAQLLLSKLQSNN